MRNFAFSLAEVLITLGIIGVVATLTIPILSAKLEEKRTINKLNNTYAILSQAYRRGISEEGSPEGWCTMGVKGDWRDFDDCSIKIYKMFTKYLKVANHCNNGYGGNGEDNCFAKTYKNRKGVDIARANGMHRSFTLMNGVSVMINAAAGDGYQKEWCSTSTNILNQGKSNIAYWDYIGICGTLWVDLNGKSLPNTDGRDLFAFKMYNDGIAPMGRLGAHSQQNFEGNCLGTAFKNLGSCTYWVLENKNMDYLRCKDLSWNGKHSCK